MPTRPKFANSQAWEQANLLIQPALIRVIDHIRKHLEASTWKGSYREFSIWPEDVAEAIRTQVAQLQQELRTASPERADAIEQTLAQLPTPIPAYELCLEQGDRNMTFNLLDMCYEVCCLKVESLPPGASLEIDPTLLDETGDVDWQQLDLKAEQVVGQIFALLGRTTSNGRPIQDQARDP